MSKECTTHDVRVSVYDSSKGKTANVVFFNDNELLLDCKRVKIVRDGSRVYFHRGDLLKDSIKLSGHKGTGDTLQLYNDYPKVKDMEGLYDLKFDAELDLYYIDKNDILSEYIHKSTHKGVKQLNHNPGNREKRGEYIVALKEPAKKIVEGKQKEVSAKSVEPEVKKTTATTIVIKALINLLKIQVEGNEDALSTIDTLEKYI